MSSLKFWGATAVGLSVFAVAACAPAENDGGSASAAAETTGETCSAADAQARLATMVVQPITPGHYGGLAISAASPLTIDQANAQLCASTTNGKTESNGDDDLTATWGAAQEMQVTYAKATGQITYVQMNEGYLGTIAFKSRPTSLTDPTKPNPFGQHTYAIGVGQPIMRDGRPWTINWITGTSRTEIFDAMMYTFAPTQPSSQTDCHAAQLCLDTVMADDSHTGVFGVRPLGLYFEVGDASGTPLQASTPSFIYAFPK